MSLMTAKEICEMLKIDITTLWRWRKQGLPAIKIGRSEKSAVRFDQEAVMEWVKSKGE